MKETTPKATKEPLIDQIMAFKEASLETLKAQYDALFGQERPCSNNRAFLWRKIAYRLQEIEYGGLSTEIQSRISELIGRYDPVNNKMLRPQNTPGKKKTTGRDTWRKSLLSERHSSSPTISTSILLRAKSKT